MADDPPVKVFASQETWERWLDRNHGNEEGVWLKVAKKSSDKRTVSVAEALEIALSYGWIDGQRKAFDGDYFLQRFTPRRLRSRWSKINRDSATALIEQGKMRPPGLAEVKRAKADGRWAAAYDSPSNIQPTPELLAALDASPKAKALFEELDSQNRYAILYRVHDAKRPETRTRRIEKFVEMLSRGETPYPRR
ncbi:MAG: YdeI/OmpD-associated family protein [Gaiellaceae bacterium]|jgi:uncharacterized protein YdeI (YjbR/CyaY-like superfamily)